MSDTDITMSLDDTLELDTIIKKSNIASNPVGTIKYEGSNSTVHNYSGIQTNTYIFDPQQSGTYTIPVNGQELTVKVIDDILIPNSVIHRWPLNEGENSIATDTVGNSNGDITGAVYTTDSKEGSYALNFNGTSGHYINTNHTPDTQSPFTWQIWIKTNGVGENTRDYIMSSSTGSNSNNVHLLVRPDGTVEASYGGGSGASTGPEATTDVLDNNWHLITFTWDGNKGRLYIDATEEDSDKTSPYESLGSIYIGSRGGAQIRSDFNYTGLADDPMVANKALSSTEILDYYNSF